MSPILVEVTRGQAVESVHRGSIAISDASGRVLKSIGDVERPVYPRSAIKPMQALYLAESGAMEHFNLEESTLALASASHNGEDIHVKGVDTILHQAGLDLKCLECGSHWPTYPKVCSPLIKKDEKPSALHNNCSGKHAGFVIAAHHLGQKLSGYIEESHPVQIELKGILEDLMHYQINQPAFVGRDGCSIPTYAVPLKNLSHASAKFAGASSMGAARDRAAKRIHKACTQYPLLVAGSKRFDTLVMESFNGEVLVKTGAEGVYCGMIPKLGLGIALKCEDGATRAAETMMAACLAALMEEAPEIIQHYIEQPIKNCNDFEVGRVRIAQGVLEKLRLS